MLKDLQIASLISRSMDPWIQYHGNLSQWIHELINPHLFQLITGRELDVCDIATGTGYPIMYLSEHFPNLNIEACDINGHYIEFSKIIHDAPRVSWKVCSAESLDYNENSFNLLTCFFAITYFNDIHKALDEMVRVVRPEGQIYIASWDGPSNALISIGEMVDSAIGNIPGDTNGISINVSNVVKEYFEGTNVNTSSIDFNQCWLGSSKEFWSFLLKSNPAIQSRIDQLSEGDKEMLNHKILDFLSAFEADEKLLIPVRANVYQVKVKNADKSINGFYSETTSN